MDAIELAPFIDHAMLRPDATGEDVDRACDDCLAYRFRGLVVSSAYVAHAKRRLKNTGVKVISTVAFPHGNMAPDVKALEAERAAAMGADEIDYVISIGAAREGNYLHIKEEGIAVLRATRGKMIKGILEIGYLTKDQRFECARALTDARIPYVKTCTGVGPGEVTPEVVEHLAEAVEGNAMIKASGGVRTREQVIALLQAGAAVIGTSNGPDIVTE